MRHLADKTTGMDAHAFLVAFCAVAKDLYPEFRWGEVEPLLERSWERYQGDGIREWADVRELVRERWESHLK